MDIKFDLSDEDKHILWLNRLGLWETSTIIRQHRDGSDIEKLMRLMNYIMAGNK